MTTPHRRRPHRWPHLGARVLTPCHYGPALRLFPAVVTMVGPDFSVDLFVMYAGSRVGAQPGFVASAAFDDAEEWQPGTWRWPPHGE